MRSKQSVAVESLLRTAKPLRTHSDMHKELKRKRRQNAHRYKLPKTVALILRPKKESIAKTTCYRLGSGPLCVMYLHGGSYVDPPMIFHWRFLQQLTREIPVTVVMPLYGRIPQHHCVRTVMHMQRVFQKLCEEFCGNVVIMGDSAGGGLALALCEYLADKCKQQPQKLVLLSPWLDVDMTGDYSKQKETDVVLNEDELRFWGETYRNKLPQGHYLASPLFGLRKGIAETHVFVGGSELFLFDCKKMKQLADEMGLEMYLYEYEGVQHVFPLYPIPEAKDARKKIEEILTRCGNESSCTKG